MNNLKNMKEQLTNCVQGQLTHMESVDTKELGEAIDMIKDLAEAIYYCTITEAMEEKEKEPQQGYYRYYTQYPIMEKTYPDYYRDMDRDYGRMYYSGNGSSRYSDGMGSGRTYSDGGAQSNNGVIRPYGEPMPGMRDSREGRSPMSRRMYMESKEMHKDKATQMRELEKYIQELSKDITEMIEDASPEEKQILKQKIATLANKIEM